MRRLFMEAASGVWRLLLEKSAWCIQVVSTRGCCCLNPVWSGRRQTGRRSEKRLFSHPKSTTCTAQNTLPNDVRGAAHFAFKARSWIFLLHHTREQRNKIPPESFQTAPLLRIISTDSAHHHRQIPLMRELLFALFSIIGQSRSVKLILWRRSGRAKLFYKRAPTS